MKSNSFVFLSWDIEIKDLPKSGSFMNVKIYLWTNRITLIVFLWWYVCNALKTIVHTNLMYYDYCCDNNTSTEFLCDLIENIYYLF